MEPSFEQLMRAARNGKQVNKLDRSNIHETPNPYQELRSCISKIPRFSKEQADKAAADINRDRNSDAWHSYFCQFCKNYHIGSNHGNKKN